MHSKWTETPCAEVKAREYGEACGRAIADVCRLTTELRAMAPFPPRGSAAGLLLWETARARASDAYKLAIKAGHYGREYLREVGNA